MKANEDSISLGIIDEILLNFRRRKQIINILMYFSLPTAYVATVLFGIYMVQSSSPYTALIFGFLLFSACATFFAIIYIPDKISEVINRLEATSQHIAFAMTPPKGDTPQEKILNQLIITDRYVSKIFQKNANPCINITQEGYSGKKYKFDIFIHTSKNVIKRFFLSRTEEHIFVKRYDDIT
ncbi:MAG TPA: hypothetical protein VLH35_05000, partial [Candidatus Acidoferrales bacterium]|nr:hypothetical protein [Candidatus Acidoferrales bacterium]